jgi:hypothetical protein
LVARTQHSGHLSSPRVLLEDQARVLIDALDERRENGAITQALSTFWNADDVPDDDGDIIGYATSLDSATAGQPDHSPYVALAKSAGTVVAEMLDGRGSSTRRRSVG